MNLLIVTGLSGAGKSLAMHALEDIGFFCIDNIPANLLAKLMEFAQQSENTLERVAVVLDIRGYLRRDADGMATARFLVPPLQHIVARVQKQYFIVHPPGFQLAERI